MRLLLSFPCAPRRMRSHAPCECSTVGSRPWQVEESPSDESVSLTPTKTWSTQGSKAQATHVVAELGTL